MCARPANLELREEILKAATKIVEDCGPDCVTMREVAEEVGYSPTTLYLYFKDKTAILTEIVVEGFEDLDESCKAAQVGPKPLDKLRQRSRAYIVWGMMHPGMYRLMFEGPLEREYTPEQGKRLRKGLEDGIGIIHDAIAEGQLVDIADPESYGNAAWAALHGVTSLAISRRIVPGALRMKPTEIIQAATGIGDMLLNSLIAPYAT